MRGSGGASMHVRMQLAPEKTAAPKAAARRMALQLRRQMTSRGELVHRGGVLGTQTDSPSSSRQCTIYRHPAATRRRFAPPRAPVTSKCALLCRRVHLPMSSVDVLSERTVRASARAQHGRGESSEHTFAAHRRECRPRGRLSPRHHHALPSRLVSPHSPPSPHDGAPHQRLHARLLDVAQFCAACAHLDCEPPAAQHAAVFAAHATDQERG